MWLQHSDGRLRTADFGRPTSAVLFEASKGETWVVFPILVGASMRLGSRSPLERDVDDPGVGVALAPTRPRTGTPAHAPMPIPPQPLEDSGLARSALQEAND